MKSTGILTETLVTINSKKKTASKLDEKKTVVYTFLFMSKTVIVT
jgi:hypothetical protein